MAGSATDEFLRAEQAAQFILERAGLRPRIGLVLGSGLGAVAAALRDAVRIPYEEIPHFPKSTAEGHAGILVLGTLDDIPLAVMQGRAHLYEGYSSAQVVLPVRALERMGVRALVLTNAAGGISADLVGMSTVPEVIAARHMGMEVMAISCVTNMAAGITGEKITAEEVLETGERLGGKLLALLRAVLPRIDGYLNDLSNSD